MENAMFACLANMRTYALQRHIFIFFPGLDHAEQDYGLCAHMNMRTIISTMKKVYAMDTISYSAFRSQLASTLDKVNDDHKPILITRQNGKPAVVISQEDFQSYEETAYLMASPKNAARLNQAILEAEAGKVIEKELLEK